MHTVSSAELVFPPQVSRAAHVRDRSLTRGVRRAIVFGVLYAAVLIVQLAVGAYRAERGNYPDEAAHFMNALLVRDYLTQGLGQNPLRFAEEYYLNYPKIAPGMWPPLFHGVLGLVMLLGTPPRIAGLALLALATAWTAWRLYRIVEMFATQAVALLMASLFVLIPVVGDMTSAVMLDIVVAMFALEAIYWLALFFNSQSWRHGTLFGLLAACCCLTKANGISVLLTPLLLMCFTGQFKLLRAPGLYVAALIVAVFAFPPVALAYRLDSAIGDFGPVSMADMVARTRFYSVFLWQQLGTISLVLAVIGFAGAVPVDREGDSCLAVTLAPALKALVLAALIFHVVNPHRVMDGRYIALAVAPLLALLPLGVAKVSAFIRSVKWRQVTQAAFFAAAMVNFFVAKPAMAARRPLGYRDSVAFLEGHSGLAARRMFVVSDEKGEGAFVSEVASRHPIPSAMVIRGSKLLATDDWGGHHFQMRYASSAALMRELEDLHVDYLLVDSSPEGRALGYYSQVDDLVETNRERFERIWSIDEPRRLAVYQLKYRSPGPPKTLQVDLTYSLGKVLER